MQGGHYTASGRAAADECSWFGFNDSQLHAELPPTGSASSSAYVLMFPARKGAQLKKLRAAAGQQLSDRRAAAAAWCMCARAELSQRASQAARRQPARHRPAS
eukprot:363808-Chlamydomonas_euryale.AAC.4